MMPKLFHFAVRILWLILQLERCYSLVALRANVRSSKMWPLLMMREGLLISSFSDCLLPNEEAQDCLRRGLVRCLLTEQQQATEKALESSVRSSPCNGPNMEAMQRLERIDEALRHLESNKPSSCRSSSDLLRHASEPAHACLRFVYIPTAMYALRPESNNTPGKQRQRARADGKQRRNDIVRLLQALLGEETTIAALTLDLDDGSIKHAETTNTNVEIRFPVNGKEALRDWRPHFVYVQGGNSFWLYYCMEKGEWKDDLIQLLQGNTTFYCGASAGAILVGASMETACWKGWDDPSIVPGHGTYDDWKGVAGLKLVGTLAFFPHYAEGQWSEVVAVKGAQLKGRLGVETCCLRDDQACYVDATSGKAIIH